MRKADFVKAEAVVVSINSSGGSLTQAKHINDMLRIYAIRKKYYLSYIAPPSTVSLKTNALEAPMPSSLQVPKLMRIR